jgi:hypothetical protein
LPPPRAVVAPPDALPPGNEHKTLISKGKK